MFGNHNNDGPIEWDADDLRDDEPPTVPYKETDSYKLGIICKYVAAIESGGPPFTHVEKVPIETIEQWIKERS